MIIKVCTKSLIVVVAEGYGLALWVIIILFQTFYKEHVSLK